MSGQDVRQVVQERYGRAARQVRTGAASCCGADKDPVVDREGQVHHGAYDDLAVADDGPRRGRPDSEDRRLGRVDH